MSKCAAMVKHTGDAFYHQCDKTATRFGFCGTHLANKHPRVKTPGSVPEYFKFRPASRLTFRLISDAKYYRHAWWNKREEQIAREKCIIEHERIRREIEDSLGNVWKCEKCQEKSQLLYMRGKPITDAQKKYIIDLMKIRVLTNNEKTTIKARIKTHDRSWAFRAIHELKFHREGTLIMDDWKNDIKPF